MMKVNHLQTVYNIWLSAFFLLLLNTGIYYCVAPKMFWDDINTASWGDGNLTFVIIMLLFYHLFAYGIYYGFKLWVRLRNRINSKVMDASFLFLYILAILFMFTATTLSVLGHGIRPFWNIAVLCEQVRMFMKVYSFVRENVPRALMYKPDKDGNLEDAVYPSAKHYLYFLFVPALIYRDSYPRKETINWKFVGRNLFEFFASLFVMYILFMRFIVQAYRNTGIQPFTFEQACRTFEGNIVVGVVIYLMIFYALQHCWFNMFAELLRFGDREFYKDWWNSENSAQFFRRWNVVIYDWLYAYVYMDSNKMGLSKLASMVFVFCVSALLHDYILDLGFGLIYPVFLVLYSTIGVIKVILTRNQSGQSRNINLWFFLFLRAGFVVGLYSLEWYAQVNCKIFKESSMDYFVPRSWTQSCHILQYS